MLYQFVIQPERAEPLSLLDDMITKLRNRPLRSTHRFASVAGWYRIASRRILVLLRASGPCGTLCAKATEALLQERFY